MFFCGPIETARRQRRGREKECVGVHGALCVCKPGCVCMCVGVGVHGFIDQKQLGGQQQHQQEQTMVLDTTEEGETNKAQSTFIREKEREREQARANSTRDDECSE